MVARSPCSANAHQMRQSAGAAAWDAGLAPGRSAFLASFPSEATQSTLPHPENILVYLAPQKIRFFMFTKRVKKLITFKCQSVLNLNFSNGNLSEVPWITWFSWTEVTALTCRGPVGSTAPSWHLWGLPPAALCTSFMRADPQCHAVLRNGHLRVRRPPVFSGSEGHSAPRAPALPT